MPIQRPVSSPIFFRVSTKLSLLLHGCGHCSLTDALLYRQKPVVMAVHLTDEKGRYHARDGQKKGGTGTSHWGTSAFSLRLGAQPSSH
jgi:hypothetical protein